jgi:uncharacterized protein YjiS (DUF1127 family)
MAPSRTGNILEAGMSANVTATGVGQTSAPTQGDRNRVKRWWEAFQDRRIRQSLRTALEDLSDRELRDIGITRGEIDYVARSSLSADPRL